MVEDGKSDGRTDRRTEKLEGLKEERTDGNATTTGRHCYLSLVCRIAAYSGFSGSIVSYFQI